MISSDLAILRALADSRTFTGAARILDTSHTTVSRKLRSLEDHFGARLFERVGDHLQLTADGEHALRSANRISDEISELEKRITGNDARLSGSISMTSVDILVWHFMPAIAAFRTRFPDIELLVDTQTEVLSLSRRDAEVALRLSNDPEGYLFGHEISRFDFAVYCSESLAERPLRDQTWLDYSSPVCRDISVKWKKANIPDIECKAYLPTPLMMLAAVKEGMGIGALPVAIGEQDKTLKRVFENPSFSLGVWILAPEELRRTARVRALFDHFIEWCR